MMAITNLTRRKALLAIAFAGGIISAESPALADKKYETTDSLAQAIANNSQIDPKVRAFYLLGLSECYLAGSKRTLTEARYRPIALGTGGFKRIGRWETFLENWAMVVAVTADVKNRQIKANSDKAVKSISISNENVLLANSSIQQALTQLDAVSDPFAKLNLYFIASRLFQRSGNADGLRKCKKVLDEAFQACENNSPVDEKKIKGASSVLNLMAYGLIPFQVPDRNPKDNPKIKPPEVGFFTAADFRESEKLKLRALAMTDRLDTTNHLRRKAHRDLSLWYAQLDKPELAEKEKQILFKLVDRNDDGVLYPQAGSCGVLLWWDKTPKGFGFECGMG